MNYRISHDINYENEAVRLISMHYGEDHGYENWLKNTLERNNYIQSWLEDMMKPLIALEEEVFREASISEEDFRLYFTPKLYDPDRLGDNLVDVFCDMIRFHEGSDENERKKLFANYVLFDFDLAKETAAPSTDEFFRLLRNFSADPGCKWECYEIYCNLEEHFAHVKELLAPVIAVLKRHEGTLLKLIRENAPSETPHFLKDQQFIRNLYMDELLLEYSVFGFNGVGVRILDVSPNHGRVSYGIYVDAFVQEKARQEQASLQTADRWKSLSDKNRIRILCLLKEREMFGQELKEALGLSNATISHHMNALLVDDFVSLRKDGSRVVYSLNREKIREAIDGIKNLLLG
ncbi:MAG: winged helix-turn-helix transcriptional regulator [Clostridiales bacterium]|nr:winged helix-turn-helix transcriptional regulator [Clostridiales bacterium]